MMRKTLTAMVFVALVGCAPNPAAMYISGFSSLDIDATKGTCATRSSVTTYALGGSLDLANSEAPYLPQYHIQINVRGNITSLPLQLGTGQRLEYADRQRISLNTMRLTYQIPGLKEISEEVLVAGNWGGNDAVFLGVNIIGPKGGAALLNEVPRAANGVPTAAERIEVKVGVELIGTLSSGGTVSSETFYYPITVSHSAICQRGPLLGFYGCPFPGQDAVAVECIPPPPTMP